MADESSEVTGTAVTGTAVGVRLRRRLRWAPAALAVVVILLAAGAGLRGLVDRPPAEGSVDAGFARDMSTHHAQAVQMAMVEFRGGMDVTQRGVAQDIALTQQREIGVMSAWLTGWGLPQVSSDPPMRWMRDHGHGHADHSDQSGHADHDGSASVTSSVAGSAASSVAMPGMATDAELTRLSTAQGRDLDTLFLTLMIRHHRGGITMAQEAAARAQEPQVRALARAMVINQAIEIDQMQADLRALSAPPA